MASSIWDVAKRAGISKSTVSRVMNGGSASEKTRAAVLDAIEELQYYPNGMARGLRGIKSKVVGVVTLGTNAFEDTSTACRFAGMNNVFLASGYSMLLINPFLEPTESILANAFRYLRESRVDGLIFIGSIDSEKDRALAKQHRELVYTGERIDEKSGFRLYLGNYHYSRDLYSYLISNGHKRILTLNTRSAAATSYSERRRAAYQEVCALFNLAPDNQSFIYTKDAGLSDKEICEILYKQFVEGRYTAIFSDSMHLARDTIAYFASRGLALRDDYSLVSIERGNACDNSENPITSVCLPDHEYGEACAALMLEVLENPELTMKDVVMPYSFKVRSSVRNIG
ncbi:MAG: LacI family DNA-binding transcriptional regulator [Oscillospiraceae bacterium]|nr:LacI family DNA-binding transcriptional regulator [Oscillospiraceae bacterium]